MNGEAGAGGMDIGTVLFVAIVLAVYAAGVFSSGYRGRWPMAAVMVVMLGVPLGFVVGGPGIGGIIGVAGTVAIAWLAWRIGRNFQSPR